MSKFRRLAATVSAAAIMTCAATAVMAANIFVVGGKPDDPFWSIVKRGAEDAGKVAEAQGGKVVWLGPQNYDNLGVDAAELIRQAIDQGADAIVGPDWVPEAMDPAFKAVVDKKIPLVIYNAGGIEAADRLGAMNYVGSNDYLSGKAAGTYFAKHDLKNAVCLNTLPGAANIEALCKGMIDGVTEGGGTRFVAAAACHVIRFGDRRGAGAERRIFCGTRRSRPSSRSAMSTPTRRSTVWPRPVSRGR